MRRKVVIASVLTAMSLAVAPGTALAQDYGKNLGEFQMGNMKMTAYGERPDVAFVMMGAKREGDKVVVSFQYANQLYKDLSDLRMVASGPYAIEVVGADGKSYPVSKITLGDASGATELSTTLVSGKPVKGEVEISGVPEDVTSLSKFALRSTAQYPDEAGRRDYTYLLENVDIIKPRVVTVTPPATPTQASTADSGSRSAVVDGKAQPGKSAGIFNPVASSLASENNSWIINGDGVGPVKLGINVKAMPGRVDDLYNKVKWWNANSGSLYFDGEEAILLKVEADKITGITIVKGRGHAMVDGKPCYIGDDATQLFNRPGVEKVSATEFVSRGVHVVTDNGKVTRLWIGQP